MVFGLFLDVTSGFQQVISGFGLVPLSYKWFSVVFGMFLDVTSGFRLIISGFRLVPLCYKRFLVVSGGSFKLQVVFGGFRLVP